MNNETAWLEDLQRENLILRGFLYEILCQTYPVARGLTLETVKKLQAIGVSNLDALLAELL